MKLTLSSVGSFHIKTLGDDFENDNVVSVAFNIDKRYFYKVHYTNLSLEKAMSALKLFFNEQDYLIGSVSIIRDVLRDIHSIVLRLGGVRVKEHSNYLYTVLNEELDACKI